jgi:uncharacterized membrane-anchored protein
MSRWRRANRRGGNPSIVAPVRIGPRTKDLAKRIEPGAIAVIDHGDIDRLAAEMLVAAGVVAVVNAAPSISGRYPNGGPRQLLNDGVVLVDDVGAEVMYALRDGEMIELRDGVLYRGDEVVAKGTVLTPDDVEERMAAARLGIGHELQRFARNTLEYIDREAEITFAPLELPALTTKIKGRHALVVVRGHDYKSDLAALKPYIKEYQPVLIAVDGGADALLESGFRPDIITGDFDSLTERALRCGAELVHHVHPDGRAPGREELRAAGLRAGVDYEEFVAEGMSEDVAMLLAYEAGATLIVAVGTHSTMVEMLDKGRHGMASTFLTRLRLGPVLVDAKGVHRLYEGRIRRRDIALLIASALVALTVMMFAFYPLRVFWEGFRDLWLRDIWNTIRGWF